MANIPKYSPAEKERRMRNLREDETLLEILVAQDFSVVQLSEWHFRINGRLDVWPTSRKFYDRKSYVKGEYTHLEQFAKEHFMVQ